MSNRSVVVNYEDHTIFPTGQADGYLQFTRSGDSVFITQDGRSIGIVSAAEFDRVASLVAPF